MAKLVIMRFVFGVVAGIGAGALGWLVGGVFLGASLGAAAFVFGNMHFDLVGVALALKLVPGESAAGYLLQADVLRLLWTLDLSLHPDRKRRGIVDTQIVAISPGVVETGDRVLRGAWIERWDLNRSGEPAPYDVTFTADGQGGACFEVGQSAQGERDRSEDQNRLGAALGRQGNHEHAILAFRAAIGLDPDNAAAHLNLGEFLRAEGNLEEAITEFRAALRITPDLVVAHFNLGAALEAQGKNEEAIAAYREAARLGPEVAQIHINLGSLLRARGEPDGGDHRVPGGHPDQS